MPVEMDLLFQPIVPIESLPYPYNYLGLQTIGEFKGPGDSADWATVSQIESYACLYQMREKIPSREEITLWVIASDFAQSFFPLIDDLTPIGDGVQRGTLSRFPIYVINLSTLPITLATFPMLMVYKGNEEREKEIVQFFIQHYQELRDWGFFIELLHPIPLKEVLQSMNIESLRGFDLDMPAILELFEAEKVVQHGLQRFIRTFGTEDLARTIFSSLTAEEREKFMAQIRQLEGNGAKTEPENETS